MHDGSIAGRLWSLFGGVGVDAGKLVGIFLLTCRVPALKGLASNLFLGSRSVVGAKKPATSQLFVGPANKWLYETGFVMSCVMSWDLIE